MKPPPARVELLCIGSELLNGQVNTHQSYLSVALKTIGLSLARESSLPDDRAAIRDGVRAALRRCDVLLICGGLGPTFDDITREAVAAALGRGLSYRPRLYAGIRRKLSRHRIAIPEENKRQAFVIAGARVLPNKTGSAPGQLIVVPKRGGGARSIALMPGPFSELAPMFEGPVLRHLRRTHARGLHARSLCVHLSGVAESVADEKLAALTERPRPGAEFTILSSAGQVDFHASVRAASASAADRALAALRREIYAAVGRHVFGEGAETLESALGRRLRARKLTLSVAESCTGGMLGQRITAVAGSSDYFKGGVIAYSNELKLKLLKVRPATLARHGAVSAECALEMARGVAALTGSSLGAAVTGIAGPGGGSKAKPVGLVYLAIAGPGRDAGAQARELRLSGGRAVVRARAVGAALHLLLRRAQAIL